MLSKCYKTDDYRCSNYFGFRTPGDRTWSPQFSTLSTVPLIPVYLPPQPQKGLDLITLYLFKNLIEEFLGGVQWIKDQVLSMLWLWLLLWSGFSPWNFHMPQVQPKKKGRKKKRKKNGENTHLHIFAGFHSLLVNKGAYIPNIFICVSLDSVWILI